MKVQYDREALTRPRRGHLHLAATDVKAAEETLLKTHHLRSRNGR